MNFKNFLVIANILILFAFPITSFANSSEISTLSPACILIDADSGKYYMKKMLEQNCILPVLLKL